MPWRLVGQAQTGVDQADVGEGLWGVAELLAGGRVELLGEQAKVAAEADQAAETFSASS